MTDSAYKPDLVEYCVTTNIQTVVRNRAEPHASRRVEISAATTFLDPLPNLVFSNRVYCVKNNITSLPPCKRCGYPCGFNKKDNNLGFTKFCSEACQRYSSDLPDEVNARLSDHDWMYQKRIVERVSYKGIAAILGISEVPVRKWCAFHNFPKHKYNESPDHVALFLNNRDWLYEHHKVKLMTCEEIAAMIGSSKATVSVALDKHGIETNPSNLYERDFVRVSEPEQEIAEFIRTFYEGEILTSNRTLLGDGREIDIYIPEKKLAIEYNGVTFHTFNPDGQSSAARKGRDYHQSKTDICADKGVELIHIWSYDWLTKKNIWKSKLRAKFGVVGRRVPARKCTVREVDTSTKNTFMDANHLQGRDKATYKFGLFCGDELMSVMTFSKSRYNSTVQWELSRFATKVDCLVVGGFTKLLVHFRKLHSGSIVSYADRTHSVGNVYAKNGFRLDRVNGAGYGYVKRGTEKILNRQQFMKSKIAQPGDTRTEFEIMVEMGYRKIFDCGTLTFVLN